MSIFLKLISNKIRTHIKNNLLFIYFLLFLQFISRMFYVISVINIRSFEITAGSTL